jgi:chromosome segregation ATPase
VYVLKGGLAELPAEAGLAAAGSPVVADDAVHVDRDMAGVEHEYPARQRLEEQLQLVRGELAESGQKLGECYGRINRLEQERRQFAEQTRELRENHAVQLQALSAELDQERMRTLDLRKSLGEVKAERDVLRTELDSERTQSGMQLRQLQAQLEQAHDGAAAVLPADGADGDAHAEVVRLRSALQLSVTEKRNVENQLKQLVDTIEVMRESVNRLPEALPAAQPGEGRDPET